MRILLEVVLPFLAPFALFALYRLLVTRGRPLLERTPWFLLTVMGLVLAGAALVSLALSGGWGTGGRYVPPHVENGRIVPGEVVPQ